MSTLVTASILQRVGEYTAGVEEALQRADELMQAWTAELRRELPEGADIFDAHVHLGQDIDGFRGDYGELERIQQRFGISRAFMFCLDEPDRHPAFRAANDRTLEFADRSRGRLIPCVPLGVSQGPREAAAPCTDR